MGALKITFFQFFSFVVSHFFDWLYSGLAWSYDLVAGVVSLGRWQKWVLAMLPFAAPGPTLEVGFGPGHLMQASRLNGQEIFGIDLSRQMCNLAGKRLKKSLRMAPIARADIQNAPFANETFSRILATFPAAYLFSSATARACYRLLKADGLLVILLSVRMNGQSLPERFFRAIFQAAGPDPVENLVTQRLFPTYQEQGFQTTYRWQPSGQDDLLVLIFHKPGFIIKGF